MNTILDEKITNEIVDKLDDIELPVPKFINAPEDLSEAIDRIMRLETALDDLARAVEIAVISRQFDLVDGFKDRANDLLVNKITIDQPSNSEFKLTVIDSKKSKEDKQ